MAYWMVTLQTEVNLGIYEFSKVKVKQIIKFEGFRFLKHVNNTDRLQIIALLHNILTDLSQKGQTCEVPQKSSVVYITIDERIVVFRHWYNTLF